jgi:antitoxin (DNA-binding transcriptional repressor) of toxin-antitoxin stability system
MTTVNMLAAMTQLSRLVEAIESGAEREIIIARNGKPAAKQVPLTAAPVDVSKRIGIAKGKFVVPDEIDNYNDEIAALLYGDER